MTALELTAEGLTDGPGASPFGALFRVVTDDLAKLFEHKPAALPAVFEHLCLLGADMVGRDVAAFPNRNELEDVLECVAGDERLWSALGEVSLRIATADWRGLLTVVREAAGTVPPAGPPARVLEALVTILEALGGVIQASKLPVPEHARRAHERIVERCAVLLLKVVACEFGAIHNLREQGPQWKEAVLADVISDTAVAMLRLAASLPGAAIPVERMPMDQRLDFDAMVAADIAADAALSELAPQVLDSGRPATIDGEPLNGPQ